MADSVRRNWTKDELVAVLSLYCQLSFGQLDARNPAVVQLARHLGRSPSAIALKLVNFASLDPSLRARGVRGMGNVSKLDRATWAEYHEDWSLLSQASPVAAATQPRERGVPAIAAVEKTEVLREQRVRVGQHFFRNAVLASYRYKCCITGIEHPALLRASHIIPWAKCERERLNPRNGLCLSALHDAAFDHGLLTIDKDCRVVLSRELAPRVPPPVYESAFAVYAHREILVPEKFPPLEEALDYHRREVFRI